MLLIAPLATFVTLFLALNSSGIGGRKSFLYAATWLGVATVGVTEGLSAAHLLTRPAVGAAWFGILLICAGVGRTRMRLGMARFRESVAAARAAAPSLGRLERAALAGISIIVLSVAVLALVCPPNVQDVMEYHLPRVMMWMGNRSVAFFPTPDYAQLVHGPFAEFAILHVDLLWGSDRLVNLVETASFIGDVLAVSSIAAALGAGRRGQLLAALACVTLPSAVLEASGSMNTAVVSLWIAIAVLSLLAYREQQTWLDALTAAAALGLAMLTKGIAFAFIPPLMMATLLMLRPASRISLLKKAPLLALLALAINLPQALRNRDLTGAWLGAPFADAGPVMDFPVVDLSPGQMLANTLRNLSLHLNLRGLSRISETVIRAAIRGLGQDPDDRQSIFIGLQYGHVGLFSVPPFARNEIKTGNPISLALALAAIAWAFAARLRRKGSQEVAVYAAGLVVAFLFFSLMLRWQTWGARFQLPLFVLSAALIGLFLQARSPRTQSVAVAVLLVGVASYAFRNDIRSWIPRPLHKAVDVYRPRADLYFADDHLSSMPDKMTLVGLINRSSCQTLAFDSYNPTPDAKLLESPESFFVYPLMALTGVDTGRRSAWYEGVHNLSAKYAPSVAHPRACAVACLSCAGVEERLAAYRSYPNAQTVGKDVLFSEQSL